VTRVSLDATLPSGELILLESSFLGMTVCYLEDHLPFS
jgi:hypothetical protein